MATKKKRPDPHKSGMKYAHEVWEFFKMIWPNAKEAKFKGTDGRHTNYIVVPTTRLSPGFGWLVVLTSRSRTNARRTLISWIGKTERDADLNRRVPVVVSDEGPLPFRTVTMPLWAFAAILLRTSSGVAGSRYTAVPTNQHLAGINPKGLGDDQPRYWEYYGESHREYLLNQQKRHRENNT